MIKIFEVPLISIIYPSYNGEQFIRDNLKSLQSQYNVNEIEVIIVDNNSTDSTKEIIKSFNHVKINLIEQKCNLGYAKACNIGACIAKGKFIFFTNQDMTYPKEFFQITLKIFKELSRSNNIILCPVVLFNGGENKNINYFGAKIHFLGFSYTPEMYLKISEGKKTFKTLKAPGGSMFMKRDTFFKLNGFDPNFFMYHEDTDFSLRAIRKNIQIFTTNETSLIHLKHQFKLSEFSYYYLERNRYLCIFKNLEKLRCLIPYIIISELMLLFHAILTKKIKIRFKIYKFFIQNYSQIKHLRFNKSNCKTAKIKKRELSTKLDPILLGKSLNHNKLFGFFVKIINLIL